MWMYPDDSSSKTVVVYHSGDPLPYYYPPYVAKDPFRERIVPPIIEVPLRLPRSLWRRFWHSIFHANACWHWYGKLTYEHGKEHETHCLIHLTRVLECCLCDRTRITNDTNWVKDEVRDRIGMAESRDVFE